MFKAVPFQLTTDVVVYPEPVAVTMTVALPATAPDGARDARVMLGFGFGVAAEPPPPPHPAAKNPSVKKTVQARNNPTPELVPVIMTSL